jgi:predicted metal-dependent hydrolase
MKKLVVGSDVIPYTIVYSPRARRKRVAIAPSGIRVVLPRGAAEKEGIEFIESVKGRVYRARKKVLEQHARHQSLIVLHYVSGARIPFFGREIILVVQPEKRKRSAIHCEDGELVVKVPAALAARERETQVKKRVEDWMKAQMWTETAKVIPPLEKKIGVRPKGLRVKSQKKLWGSCGKNHVINLNWKLSLFPRKVFEYVVVHEMCHLRHMNHSRDYWSLVERVMPDYRKYKDWLRFMGSERL